MLICLKNISIIANARWNSKRFLKRSKKSRVFQFSISSNAHCSIKFWIILCSLSKSNFFFKSTTRQKRENFCVLTWYVFTWIIMFINVKNRVLCFEQLLLTLSLTIYLTAFFINCFLFLYEINLTNWNKIVWHVFNVRLNIANFWLLMKNSWLICVFCTN